MQFLRAAESKRDVLMAASDEVQRKAALKALKKHYEKTYKTSQERNAISLFLYAGGNSQRRWVPCGCGCSRLRHAPGLGDRLHWTCTCRHRRASVLYTGDGYLNTVDRWNRLAQYLGPARVKDLFASQVLHHGARGNWYPGLAASIGPYVSVFSSDPDHKRFRHPHEEVVEDFGSIGGRTAQVDRRRGVGFTAVW